MSGPRAGQQPGNRPPMMPANVRAGQVVSLVEVTGGLGSPINVALLADEMGADIAVLLPILDTAEMLGLVRSEKGDVSLTEFGRKFQKATKNKVRMLHDQVSGLEPFKTALELASRRREVRATEISDALFSRGVRWHHDRELNEELVRTMLIHWAIYAGLLSYDGRRGTFQKV